MKRTLLAVFLSSVFAFTNGQGVSQCGCFVNPVVSNCGITLQSFCSNSDTTTSTVFAFLWCNGSTSASLSGVGNGTYTVTVSIELSYFGTAPHYIDTCIATLSIPVSGCSGSTTCGTQDWYLDFDNDGYYSQTQQAGSSPGAGWTTTLPVNGMGDCDDNDDEVNPGATPTINDLAVTVQDPQHKGCEAIVTIDFFNRNCRGSYNVMIEDNNSNLVTSASQILQNVHPLTINTTTNEPYIVKVVDDKGVNLQKQIVIDQPQCNAQVSYTVIPPSLTSCINTVEIELVSDDCFNSWLADITGTNLPNGTFIQNNGTGGVAAKGNKINYTIVLPASSNAPVFTVSNVNYTVPGGEQCTVPAVEITGVQSQKTCVENTRTITTIKPTNHCSSDGKFTFTLSTPNPCQSVFKLDAFRKNPTNNQIEEFYPTIESSIVPNTNGTGFTATIEFNNLKSGLYDVILTTVGVPLCSEQLILALNSAESNNILPLALTINKTDMICGNDKKGVINAVVLEGKKPYNYKWFKMQPPQPDLLLSTTTSQLKNLETGTYYVEVTDGSGCIISNKDEGGTEILAQNPPIEVQQSQNNVTTFKGSNGSATALASGGNPPYEMKWNTKPPKTFTNILTSTVNNLKAGNYTVTIKDMIGCSTTSQFTITEPPLRIGNYVSLDIQISQLNDKNIQILSHNTIGLLELFDISGKKVQEEFINANSAEINISELKNGFYILRIGEKQFKIIKQ